MDSYFSQALEVLESIRSSEADTLEAAARHFASAVAGDRIVYTFGTGHSSLLAAEGLFRAGGLASVSAILEPPFTFESGAVASSTLEKQAGLVASLLDRYPIGQGDVLVVFSNSGVNAVPVEAAAEGKRRGATVIAITSREYAQDAARRKGGVQTIADVAHLTIDNHVPPGDAVVEVGKEGLRVASVSTVAGAFIWNALVARTVSLLQDSGTRPPVYISSNMPDSADNNRALVERYRPRIRHL